jgi:nitrite reductase/ring-hydroxylating ferredoxin subunit
MAWVAVASLSEIPQGQAKYVETGRVALAVFNAGSGRVFAVHPVCPHDEGPLAEGWVESGAAVCPWHGYTFDLATGACRVDEDLAVATYPARVVGDTVEVDLP